MSTQEYEEIQSMLNGLLEYKGVYRDCLNNKRYAQFLPDKDTILLVKSKIHGMFYNKCNSISKVEE